VASTIDGYSLEEARTALAEWKAAISALSTSQSYDIGTRSLTRVDLPAARDQVQYFAKIVEQLSGTGGGVRVVRVVPRDL
jgi:hypothetical protein